MRPDSPGPDVFGSMCLGADRAAEPNATITNASQPKVAVFQ